jgi:hypothetical protein
MEPPPIYVCWFITPMHTIVLLQINAIIRPLKRHLSYLGGPIL